MLCFSTLHKKHFVISILLSIVITCCINIGLTPIYDDGSTLEHILSCIKPFRFSDTFTFIGITCLIIVVLVFHNHIKKAYHILSLGLSFFFALMHSLGQSYEKYNSAEALFCNHIQVFKFIINTLGFFLLFYFLIYLIFCFFELLKNNIFVKTSEDRFTAFVRNHHLRFFLIMLLATGLIYLIFMPGLLTGDTASQIFESFGIEAYYFPAPFPYLYPDSRLTNMHSIISTFFIHYCLILGNIIFGSYNAGLFIAGIIQFSFSVFVISRSCLVFAKLNIRGLYILLYLIYIYTNIFIVTYFFVFTKDVFYTSFLYLFTIELYLLISEKAHKLDYFLITFAALGTVAFRAEGLYCVLIILIISVIILLIRKRRTKITIFFSSICFALILIHVFWINAVFPMLHITPAVKSLQLTIPMQQVGRYVSNNNELTSEEYSAIDSVMDVEEIKINYDPTDADELKRIFKHNCSDEELKAFIHVWLKICLKDPANAFSAWFNNKYEYFYFGNSTMYTYSFAWSRSMLDSINQRTLNNTGIDLDLHYPKNSFLTKLRVFAEGAIAILKKIPAINTFLYPALYVLLLFTITVFMIINKNKLGKLLLLVPWFTFIITNLISASNASYGRYMYPIIIILPFILFANISSSKSY